MIYTDFRGRGPMWGFGAKSLLSGHRRPRLADELESTFLGRQIAVDVLSDKITENADMLGRLRG